jgi:very-long-chain (3R)-3-hydroxyacyl-CoA dehydratase
MHYPLDTFTLSLLRLYKMANRNRYNTFLVLYPIGVASETWLVYNAIGPASKMNENYGYILYGVLATYVPGFYILFMHMLSQRRRVMRDLRAKRA